jgi:hypothetical protein
MGTLLAATTGNVATTTEVIVVLALYGVAGYLLATWTRRRIGTTPWRLPAIVWAFLSALLPFYGLLLELVARFTTRHAGPGGVGGRGATPSGAELGARSGSGAPWDPWPTPGGGSAGSPYGAWPGPGPMNPAGGSVPWPERVLGPPGPGGWRPPAPGTAAPEPPPLFGWYPDPDGRHELRYWDGREWSDIVRDGNETSSEPLADWAPSASWSGPTAGSDAPPTPWTTQTDSTVQV